jgi:hypothetical protein
LLPAAIDTPVVFLPYAAGVDFLRQNPAPFKLPGSQLFKIPLDYVPDEEAVKRRKYWTGWKVGMSSPLWGVFCVVSEGSQ